MQNKYYPIPFPLQNLCYLLVPTRAQNGAQLKEFCVTQWRELPPKIQKYDDSGCSVKSSTTDALCT